MLPCNLQGLNMLDVDGSITGYVGGHIVCKMGAPFMLDAASTGEGSLPFVCLLA